MTQTAQRNTIRTWALVSTVITSGFVFWFIIWYTQLLSASNWCARAIGAAQDTNRPEAAINGCFKLLSQQVDALAWALIIFAGTQALCLLVLVIIILAGGRVSFTANKTGISGSVVRDDAPITPEQAADHVADAANQAADEVAEEGKK